jgi:hypothetical protein
VPPAWHAARMIDIVFCLRRRSVIWFTDHELVRA